MNIYKLALQVQDASNIQGVIKSLNDEVLPAIRLEPGYREQGTGYVAHHAAVLLFIDKIVSLAEAGWISYHHDTTHRDYTWAYTTCQARADEDEAGR